MGGWGESFVFSSFIVGLQTTEKSPGARAEVRPLFSVDIQKVEDTCSREQRSFRFRLVHQWPHTVFALIYCPLTKTCDYPPSLLSGFPSPKKLLFLKWYKSHNWACFERRCQCMGHRWSGWILLNATPLHTSLGATTPLHIPSRVTRITSFSPNGHFGWQVHYTLYFQIVYPLLMPGRLIALAASPGKGLTSTAATRWKTVITVFL